MKKEEIIKNELNRRREEVEIYRDRTLNSQESIKDFYEAIADYMNYAFEDDLTSTICEEMKTQVVSSQETQGLEGKKNQVFLEFQNSIKVLKETIKDKGFKLSEWKKNLSEWRKKAPPPYQSEMIIPEPNPSLLAPYFLKRFDRFFKRIKKADKSIGIAETSQEISFLWMLIGALEDLGINGEELRKITSKLRSLHGEMKEKIYCLNRRFSFQKYPDYLKLKNVWNCIYRKVKVDLGKRSLENLFAFKDFPFTKKYLSEEYLFSSIREGDKRGINNEKEKHLRSLHRFHNFLLDKLERASFKIHALNKFKSWYEVYANKEKIKRELTTLESSSKKEAFLDDLLAEFLFREGLFVISKPKFKNAIPDQLVRMVGSENFVTIEVKQYDKIPPISKLQKNVGQTVDYIRKFRNISSIGYLVIFILGGKKLLEITDSIRLEGAHLYILPIHLLKTPPSKTAGVVKITPNQLFS